MNFDKNFGEVLLIIHDKFIIKLRTKLQIENAQAGEPLPGMVFWWQGDIASAIDFTNAAATEWWTGRLQKLLQEIVL